MTGQQPDRQPNILLVLTDQQSAHMLGCAGTSHVRTPHLDALAAAGTRLERAYVTFPLCVPSRVAMMTGQYPHRLGVHSNAEPGGPDVARGPQSLPQLLAGAGYECAYAGKWHAIAPSASEADGFKVIKEFGDAGLVESAREFLTGRDRQRPFFLVASFDDPHTICEVARGQPSYYGELPAVETDAAPNLPANFGSQPFQPEALRSEQRAAEKVYGTGGYTPEQWRGYRAAYAALVERVDARIGALLQALAESGHDQDTVVVFTSDHGDGDAAHGWNQKTALYEEIVRVPLIIARLGEPEGDIDHRLVNTGVDLLPTLCDLAGVEIPAGLPGRSLVGEPGGHEHVVVQTTFADGPRPHTRGRAVITERYKYVVYSWGRYREQLHDLRDDPGEQVNLAVEARHRPVLEAMRGRLLQWCLEQEDHTMLGRLVLPAHTPQELREQIYAVPY